MRVPPAVVDAAVIVAATVAITVPVVTSRWAQHLASLALSTVLGTHGSQVLLALAVWWVAAICLVTALWGALGREHRSAHVRSLPTRAERAFSQVRHRDPRDQVIHVTRAPTQVAMLGRTGHRTDPRTGPDDDVAG